MDTIIAGFTSGLIQTLLGHPYDTLKTWHQNASILKMPPLKFKNLYKGISYSLIKTPLLFSATFYSNYYIKQKTNNVQISSLATGLISSIITTPLHKYKVIKQQNLKYDLNLTNILYSYKKMHIIMLREIPAKFIYFSTFDKFKQYNIPVFLSGAISGTLSWSITYPCDTIKSRILSGKCKTIKEAYLKKDLFKGLQPCLVRAFIVNGMVIYIYEKVLEMKIYTNLVK